MCQSHHISVHLSLYFNVPQNLRGKNQSDDQIFIYLLMKCVYIKCIFPSNAFTHIRKSKMVTRRKDEFVKLKDLWLHMKNRNIPLWKIHNLFVHITIDPVYLYLFIYILSFFLFFPFLPRYEKKKNNNLEI